MKPERWKEIEELYQGALKKPADERPAFLDAACNSDDDLRSEVESLLARHSDDDLRSEVESLLARHSDADGLLEDPALDIAAKDLAGETESLVGTEVGSYRIVSRLGSNGMGEVYLADHSSLGRQVALKFLPPHLQQHETARKRFLREAKAAAGIDHPYICSIHEVGHSEGRDFISMEHVDGQTLQDKLASPIRSWDVGPDGRFWVIGMPDEAARQATADRFFRGEIRLVQNWFEELRRLVPVGE